MAERPIVILGQGDTQRTTPRRCCPACPEPIYLRYQPRIAVDAQREEWYCPECDYAEPVEADDPDVRDDERRIRSAQEAR